MPLEHLRSCGRSRRTPVADNRCPLVTFQLTHEIYVDGCSGGSLRGAVRFRNATKAVIHTIAKKTAIASVTTVRPVLGLPAIKAQVRCAFTGIGFPESRYICKIYEALNRKRCPESPRRGSRVRNLFKCSDRFP